MLLFLLGVIKNAIPWWKEPEVSKDKESAQREFPGWDTDTQQTDPQLLNWMQLLNTIMHLFNQPSKADWVKTK